MKRLIIGLLLLLPLTVGAQSLQAGIGADFFTYDRTFLDLHATFLKQVKPDVELSLGGSFALATKNENGTVEADFLSPSMGA